MGRNYVAYLLAVVALPIVAPSPAPQCYTLRNLQDATCNIICIKDHDEYERGVYDESTQSCWCMNHREYQTRKVPLTLPRRYIAPSDTDE